MRTGKTPSGTGRTGLRGFCHFYIFPRITGCGLVLAAAGAYSALALGNTALQFPNYQMLVMLTVMLVCFWYLSADRPPLRR